MRRHRWYTFRSIKELPKHYRGIFCGILGIGMAFCFIFLIEHRLTPILETMALAQVTQGVTQALNGITLDHLDELHYQKIVTMEKNQAGDITALTSNMATLNGLRTSISALAVAAVENIDTELLGIPIGNLTGINLFSGRGVTVPIEVSCAGTSHVSYENRFSEAGINQTQHQIFIELTVDVNVILPTEIIPTQVTVTIPVAETIIVGVVPDTYLNMGESIG